jgi:hypothetical protein
MREVVFGILVKAKDAASAVMKKSAESAKASSKSIDDAVKKTKDGFKDFKQSVIAVNAGLQLLSRVAGSVTGTVEKLTQRALEQRQVWDPQRLAVEKFGIAIESAEGSLGDVLIPILLGVADAVSPILKGMDAWTQKNKALVGGKIVEYLAQVAHIVVSGVATGVLLVTRVWNGWIELVNVTRAIFESYWSMIADGISMVIGGMQQLADAAGLDTLSSKLKDARDAVTALSSTLQDSSDEHVAAAARAVASQEELEKQIDDVAAAIHGGIDVASVQALKHMADETRKLPPHFAEVQARLLALRLEQLKIKESAAEYTTIIKSWGEAYQEARLAPAEKDAERYVDKLKSVTIDTIDTLKVAWASYYKYQSVLSRETQIEIEQYLKDKGKEVTASLADEIRGVFDTIAGDITSSMDTAFAGIGRLQNDTVIDLVKNEKGFYEEQERIVAQHVKTTGDAFKELLGGVGKMFASEIEHELIALATRKLAEQAAAIFSVKASAAEAGAKAAASEASIPFIGPALAIAAGIAMSAAVIAAFAGTFHTGGTVPGPWGKEQLALVEGGEVITSKEDAAAGAGGGANVHVTTETVFPTRTTVDLVRRDDIGRSEARLRRLGAL